MKGANLNSGNLYISNIFSNYADDFMNKSSTPSNFPDLYSFLIKYTNNSQNMDIYNYVLANKNAITTSSLKYISYDWKLNGEITTSICPVNRLCISMVFIVLVIGIISVVIILIILFLWFRKKRDHYTEVD